ncbi:MAG: riboflavin synthase [Chthoniobacteraceae bacterium]
MFTGLVETTGTLCSFTPTDGGARLEIKASFFEGGVAIGDSIAVNGCCLTITKIDGAQLAFDLLAETLRLTNLGELKPGALVNLERALAANARLGGHFVSGHIDCTSEVQDFSPHGSDYRLEVTIPAASAQYVIHKGSIAINGISLTIAEVRDASVVLWIIPHTREVTNLSGVTTGSRVNLEFDLLAKYMERAMLLAAKREP